MLVLSFTRWVYQYLLLLVRPWVRLQFPLCTSQKPLNILDPSLPRQVPLVIILSVVPLFTVFHPQALCSLRLYTRYCALVFSNFCTKLGHYQVTNQGTENRRKFSQGLYDFMILERVLCNHPCPSVVCQSVSSSVRSPSLNISETALRIFLNFCMKLVHHKGTKVTEPDF